MPVQTIICPECNGKGYIVVFVPTPLKPQKYVKRRQLCPKCGGLGVIKTEIPDFIPKELKHLVMF